MQPNINLTNATILKMTEDQNAFNLRKEAQRLVEKWTKTNLLEGLTPEKQQNLAFLLENEAKELKGKILSEQTSVGDIAGFNKIAFPLVRRVFAQLLTNDIVSVQPMQMPSGLVFYLDYTYERTKAGHTAGDSVYGTRETVINQKRQGIGAQTGKGGFFDLQRLGYASRSFIIGTATPTANGLTAQSGSVTGVLSGFTFNIASAALGKVDMLARYAVRPALSGELNLETGTYSTFRSMQAVASLTADTLSRTIDVNMTTFPTSSTVVIWSNTSLTAASLSSVNSVILLGRADTLLQDSTAGPNTLLGDFESTSDIPQINAKILSTFIMSQTKKLKTIWTPELSQDLNAYMALDAEVELTNILSEQIATEIDREILGDLLGVAAVKAAWSRKIGRYMYVDENGIARDASSANVTFSNQAFYGTQDDWHNTLGHVSLSVSNRIYKLNLRHGANWIVCGLEGSSIIEGMGKWFKAVDDSSDYEQTQYSFGIEKVGTLQGRWQVYKDPYFPSDVMLMGYKGKTQLDAGYIWSPYISLLVTPTIFSPDNFNPLKGVMTRNGKAVIRPDFYGTVKLFDVSWQTFV